MTRPDVSIVIACYNEITYLDQSVAEVRAVMDRTRYTYELIFVDDCSRDGTPEIIRRLAAGRSDVKALFHGQNQGRGATVADGLRLAEGPYAGYLDIDLEVHARYIPTMIRALEQGVQIATAYRIYKLKWSKLHRQILSLGYAPSRDNCWDIPSRIPKPGSNSSPENPSFPFSTRYAIGAGSGTPRSWCAPSIGD